MPAVDNEGMKRLLTLYKALQDITIVHLCMTDEKYRPYLEQMYPQTYVQQKLQQYHGIHERELQNLLLQLEKERRKYWNRLKPPA